MPIELVPNNKHGLTLASPLIAGAGAVGYADVWPPGVTAAMFGAIVTPPVSWRPRRGKRRRGWPRRRAGLYWRLAITTPATAA